MNISTTSKKLWPAILLLFLISSCAKQPETIVVSDSPESPGSTAQTKDTTAREMPPAQFRQLIIGEPHPIPTLDPLFADNNSARRALQVLFEGLVRLNEQGNLVPALARSWSVSNDSLSYSFVLRSNIYFHDSEVFSNGLGRRVVAPDLKFAFERMAKNSVPDRAAQLFMSIEGFEPYFNEQHHVLNPALRELDGIGGIATPNDSTVRFTLIDKDPHFLQKMASPYAVVYPREAVRSQPNDFAGVGTGPFELSQRRGDSLYVFSKFKGYRQEDNTIPKLDRVDLKVITEEGQQFKELARGDIHLLPEIGPRIMENTLTESGELRASYSSQFLLSVPGGRTTYTISHYPGADVSRESVLRPILTLEPSQLTAGLPSRLVSMNVVSGTVSPDAPSLPSTLYSTYSDESYHRFILQSIAGGWGGQHQLQMMQILTPTRHTALYTGSFVPYYPGDRYRPDSRTLIYFSVGQAALSIKQLENIEFNRYPWWIDLRNANLPGIDQL